MPAPQLESIDASTRYCAVYGHPVRHSASPAMQNAALKALGLRWRYLAFDVEPASLKEAIRGAQAMGFIGLNLTVPHKILAAEMVDLVDPGARRWGAVNTIRYEGRAADGSWKPLAHFSDSPPSETRSVGFNTDAAAIVRSIREDLDLSLTGKRVVLLGAGGAGRAAALRLAEERPAALTLINRTRVKAELLAAEIAALLPGINLGSSLPSSSVDLLLNTTSLGLNPDDELPVAEEWLRAHPPNCVYDMIYRPAETLLLKTARALGSRTANGLGMLLHQGADALELWSGRNAPRDVMRRALENAIYG